METKKNKQRLHSQQGNVMVLVLSFLALISSLIFLNLSTTKSYMDQMFYQSDAMEREKLLNTTVGLLNEQQICEAIFTNGFNTNEGTHPISSATLLNVTGRAHDRVETALKDFSDFELKSIQLSSPVTFASSDGVQYKQFAASFTVGPKADASDNSKKLQRVFGLRSAGVPLNKDENLFFVVGSNNRCYFHRNLADPSTAGLDAIAQTCRSLGGEFANSRCNVREFKVDPNGILITKKNQNQTSDIVDLRKSDLADALCQMELTALQKLGPHVINQSGGKRAYGWTSLCEKPQWAGCRENNQPESSTLYNPGHLLAGQKIWSGKNKDLGKTIREMGKVTVDRRASRALPYSLMSDAWNSTNPEFHRLNSGVLGLANIFGGAAAFALTQGNAEDLVGIFAMNLIWGPVIGGLMIAFGPKCDAAELYADRRCVQGYFETERMSYRVEKIKYTWRGPRCQWKGLEPIEPVVDEDGIIKMALNKGVAAQQTLELASNTGISKEDLADLTREVASVRTLPELFKLAQGFAGENPDQAIPMPPELQAIVQAREQQLLLDLQQQVQTALNSSNLFELKNLNAAVTAVISRAPASNYAHSPNFQSQLAVMSSDISKALNPPDPSKEFNRASN